MPQISLDKIVTTEVECLASELTKEQREAFMDSRLYSEIMTGIIRSEASWLVNELFHLGRMQGAEPDAKKNAPYLLRSLGTDEQFEIVKTIVRAEIAKKLSETK